MPGEGVGRDGAREQLMPKNEGIPSSSTAPEHRYIQSEATIPGTAQAQTTIDYPAASVVLRATPNGYAQLEDGNASPGASALTTSNNSAEPRQGGPALPSRAAAEPSTGGSSNVVAMEIQEALLPSQLPPHFEHPIPLGRRRWMVTMFCLTAALLYADQNLLAPNLTAAAEYFGMDERQKDTLLGGALMAAFFAVGAPAALLVGWLTDRGDINRRTLLFWVVVVGETPCLLTYWVKSYWQFFLLRALTGVAVGGCFPLVFSLLGDLFPPKRRAAVSAVVQIATGAGLAVGQALSGAVGPATNWRLPFVLVAAPSLGVAGLLLATTREPPRGAFEEALRERYAEGLGSYEGSISWSKVAVLLRCPSNAIVIAQGLPGSLPWGMVLTYFNDFLSQQKGFSVQAATLVLLFFGGGGVVGVIGGGAGGQWLYNRRKEYQALLAGGCALAGIAPLYGLINADLKRLGLPVTALLAALGGAVASVPGPNLRSVMLNVNEPETRGVALALQSMTDDLGKGLGPVLVAGLIRAMGRQGAFNVATAGWVPCALLLTALAATLRRDEAAMQSRLAKSSDRQAAAAAAAAGGRGGGDGRGGSEGEAEGGSAGGVGGELSVPMPPPSPPLASRQQDDDEGGGSASGSGRGGGGGSGGAHSQGGWTGPYAITAAASNAVAAWREERRLARTALLDGADSSSSSAAVHSFDRHGLKDKDLVGAGGGVGTGTGQGVVAGGAGGRSEWAPPLPVPDVPLQGGSEALEGAQRLPVSSGASYGAGFLQGGITTGRGSGWGVVPVGGWRTRGGADWGAAAAPVVREGGTGGGAEGMGVVPAPEAAGLRAAGEGDVSGVGGAHESSVRGLAGTRTVAEVEVGGGAVHGVSVIVYGSGGAGRTSGVDEGSASVRLGREPEAGLGGGRFGEHGGWRSREGEV